MVHASQLGRLIPRGLGQLKRRDTRKVSPKKNQILKHDTSILNFVKFAMMPGATHNFIFDFLHVSPKFGITFASMGISW